MHFSVGTFNLNNLFSRYNFRASISQLQATAPRHEDISVTYSFDSTEDYALRTFQGRLIKEKDARETQMIADRILLMNVDLLAVQEVEDIAVLKQFNSTFLGGLYSEAVLVEGNDERLIDVGLLCKYPIGAVTSYQTATHPEDPGRRVFGRDLVAAEVLDMQRKRKLFTLYNTHLKSHYVDFREDPLKGQEKNDTRRRRQAETIAHILTSRERKGSKFILVGDMNDPVDSPVLAPMLTVDGERLLNGLSNPVETRPAKKERQGDGPQTPSWTYRHNPPGVDRPPQYGLYDQIWISPRLSNQLTGGYIDRRLRHGGDGSDHDPAWIQLTL